MSCAVAVTACAQAEPRPLSTLPTTLIADSPKQRSPEDEPTLRGSKAEGDLTTSEPDPWEAPTGAPCDTEDDCGVDRLCIEGWPGGFCTGACDIDADCLGAGAVCVVPLPSMTGFCAVSCMDDIECGDGYACDGRRCWPAPPPID
jgi:hypothetical protein